MTKKDYLEPSTEIVMVELSNLLLASPVTSVSSGDAGIGYGGGGNGDARSRENNFGFDDE